MSTELSSQFDFDVIIKTAKGIADLLRPLGVHAQEAASELSNRYLRFERATATRERLDQADRERDERLSKIKAA
jgi:hypothetical protein